MKILIALIVLSFAFVPVAEAKVTVKTSGNAKVTVNSTVASSSAQTVIKTCTSTLTTKGGVVIKGLECCK